MKRRWKGRPRIVGSCLYKDCPMCIPVGHLFCTKHARMVLKELDKLGLLRPVEERSPIVVKKYMEPEPC